VLDPELFERMFSMVHKLDEQPEFSHIGQDAVTGAIVVFFDVSEEELVHLNLVSDVDEIEVEMARAVLN